MTEKISIIIPVYKVEAYIRECVESVLRQTYRNLEIILVDDGSPDKCPEICEEYALADYRVQVVHQVNQGLSAARNTGMQYVSGDYILFLDSDDYLSDNYCEQVLSAACRTRSDIVVGEIITVDDAGKPVDSELGLTISELSLLDNLQAMEEVIVEQRLRGYAWGKLYRRQLLDGIAYPVGKAYEDRFTVHKYFKNAKRICLCPGAVTYYRQRPASIMHSPNLNKWYDLLEGEETFLQFCKVYYPELVNTMEAKYFGRYIHIWINFFDSRNKDAVQKLEQRMKDVYKQYGKKPYMKRMHKLSYQMIFMVPALYRWLIHVTNFDKNER